MPQRLILPINRCRVTASYKTTAYRARFGFSHYGADMVCFSGQNTVFASGNGVVAAAGPDYLLGNVVIVRYNDVFNHRTGRSMNVIARYYHLASILVNCGKVVTSNTRIALYGNTGKYSAGAHLHLEFDSNTAEPRMSKTIAGNSNLILAAPADTTIDPFTLLHCKVSAPDCQQIKADQSTFQGGYYALQECERIPVF